MKLPSRSIPLVGVPSLDKTSSIMFPENDAKKNLTATLGPVSIALLTYPEIVVSFEPSVPHLQQSGLQPSHFFLLSVCTTLILIRFSS